MKVIVGLGNPGREYENTPHNAGFAVVDELAVRLDCSFRKGFRFDAGIAKAMHGEEDVLLVKPETYMNRSGHAVASILKYKGAAAADLVVVSDDADLAAGCLRLRNKGGAGGHKGLASIIECLGTQDFARVRVGVGRDAAGDLVDHVLRRYSAGEREAMGKVYGLAADAVGCILERGMDEAMNRFNGAAVELENRDKTRGRV